MNNEFKHFSVPTLQGQSGSTNYTSEFSSKTIENIIHYIILYAHYEKRFD